MDKEEKRKPGRPKKVAPSDNPDIMTEAVAPLLMAEQNKTQGVTLSDVKKSLTGLFADVLGGNYYRQTKTPFTDLMAYNPFIQNERLKTLTTYPSKYAPSELNAAIQQPQNNEQMLRQAGASLKASQYLYYQILREAADVPLFKYFVIPPRLEKSEYNKETFKKEEAFVNEWLECFDVVNSLKKTSLEVKNEGKPTYVFRQSISTDGKPCYVKWQKLPPEYVKLTAIGERGFVASFNLMLFLNVMYQPSQYPEYIQQIWKDMTDQGVVKYTQEKSKYSLDLNKLRTYSYSHMGQSIRGDLEIVDKQYMYWVQLPQDLCFTFCSDNSNAWSIPDTVGLFSALQELTDYSTLAGLVASTPLTAVLTGQAEFVSAAQVGQDQTCLSPTTMAAFQNSFDSMVSGNIQAFLAPFKDMRLQSLPNVPNSSDIKTKAVQNFISSAGQGGIITATDKPSVAMVKGAQLLTGSQYDFVTKQFQSTLNANLRRWGGLKYKWKIILWGDIFSFNDTVKMLKEMVAAGATFLLPKLASAFDLNMVELQSICDYIEVRKIYDKFKPFNFSTMNMKNNSTGEVGTELNKKSVGRPPVDDNEITNDNTAASKDAGDDTAEMRDYVYHGICPICGETVESGHIFCESCEAEMEMDDE